MTLTFAELAGPADADYPPDFKRDQWGRPSIMQPNGKRKGYTRCSSAAKTIEDTFNLEKWARRNIAYGIAYDASLVARIIAIGGEPSTWGKSEKDQVNAILEAADAVAKAHKRADIGTAVHHLTHRLDRGETVNAGPYQADLDAYEREMLAYGLGIRSDLIECRMVNDELEMAGTADRIVKVVVHHGRTTVVKYRIADIKTGQTVDYGSLGWAAQEAAYAGGHLYDPATEQRLATPEIDQEVGYVIHLPAGEGRCTIYEVDIAAGLEAARLANQIRATRKAAKGWLKPCTASANSSSFDASTSTTFAPNLSSAAVSPSNTSAPYKPPREFSSTTPSSSTTIPTTDRRASLLARYQAMSDPEKLAFTDLKIDSNDLDAVEAGLEQVDKFNVTIPPAPLLKVVPTDPPAPPDEGGPVELSDVLALSTRYENLSPQAKAWTGALVSEGNRVWTFRIRDRPTVRRFRLYEGILTLAETFYKEKK